MRFERDVVVVGGCGHVGLPLALAFADRGLQVGIFDVNEQAVAGVMAGLMPFQEAGGQEVLTRVIGDRLTATSDPAIVSTAENVVVVIGTPVDEHLNPDPNVVSSAVGALGPHLSLGNSWSCARPSSRDDGPGGAGSGETRHSGRCHLLSREDR